MFYHAVGICISYCSLISIKKLHQYGNSKTLVGYNTLTSFVVKHRRNIVPQPEKYWSKLGYHWTRK